MKSSAVQLKSPKESPGLVPPTEATEAHFFQEGNSIHEPLYGESRVPLKSSALAPGSLTLFLPAPQQNNNP